MGDFTGVQEVINTDPRFAGTGARTTDEELQNAKTQNDLIVFNAKEFANANRFHPVQRPPTTVQGTSSTPPSGHPIFSEAGGTDAGAVFKTKLLEYPTTVGQMQDGHYIIFQIHELTKPKLAPLLKNALLEAGALVNIGEGPTFNNPNRPISSAHKSALQTHAEEKKARIEYDYLANSGPTERSIYSLYNGAKRVSTQISLYMPPAVQVSYKSNYEDTKVGVGANEVYKYLAGEQGVIDTLGNVFGENLGRMLRSTIDTLLPGAAGSHSIRHGKIISDRMELFFKGIGRRSFSYSFVFVPKSEREAIAVDSIVHEFKTAMLPRYTDGTDAGGFGFDMPPDRIMSVPTTFDIKYFMHMGGKEGAGIENGFLNKISTCYLTDAQVTYGGDKFSAHRPTFTDRKQGTALQGKDYFGAPPQRTTLTLTFNEIELITQEAAQQGY